MSWERFESVLRRLETSQIANTAERVGCSLAEIAALEARYGITLPETYRAYLRILGHKSGRLFTCDHMAVYYRHVLTRTASLRADWAEDGGQPEGFPDDALVIASRLGEQFEFIRCLNPDDSPVWYFNEWESKIVESFPSVIDWLECWCGQAEQAIASGYFEDFPDGCSP